MTDNAATAAAAEECTSPKMQPASSLAPAGRSLLFGGLAKGMGDARAEDRTGRLLRRVEMVNCGLL